MKRCKKKAESHPAYPDVKAFLRRYGRRATVGVVAGVVATTAGCDWLTGGVLTPKPADDTAWEIDGMIAETGETWTHEFGPRDLYFSDPYGWIQYRLQLVIEGTALYDWIFENPEAALAVVDAALQEEDVTAYEHDDGYDTAEQRIVEVLMQAYANGGGSRGSIVHVELIIDHYEDEDDILGDMETTR